MSYEPRTQGEALRQAELCALRAKRALRQATIEDYMTHAMWLDEELRMRLLAKKLPVIDDMPF